MSSNTLDALKMFEKMCVARSENAYSNYIAQCRIDKCLGEDAKMLLGSFGRDELEAHKEACILLGKHQAYVEILAFSRANIDCMLKSKEPDGE